MHKVRALRLVAVIFALALLSACGGQVRETAAPTAAPPGAGPALDPTTPATAAAPTANQPAADSPFADIPQGRTAEGYQQLGAADAPVTLVMYSDFL
jgi:hypothetical protein